MSKPSKGAMKCAIQVCQRHIGAHDNVSWNLAAREIDLHIQPLISALDKTLAIMSTRAMTLRERLDAEQILSLWKSKQP